MKRFATFTVLVLLTMLLLAGTAAAQTTVSGVYSNVYGWVPDISGGWANSNRSGETLVVWDGAALLRNVPGQLTHTAFQLNTNSCASCHMTHTAIGANLLIRSTTSATCEACHDGTMGFLNVNAPATATGMGGSVAAGTFGVNAARTPSMHDVDAAVTMSGAPGGNRLEVIEQAGASWDTLFTCASCHAPHGSHSIRLLHANPNNLAVRSTVGADVYVAGGRYQVSTAANLNLNTFTTATHANQVTTANVTGTIYTYTLVGAPAAPWVAGYSESYTIGGARTSAFWTRLYHLNWNPNTVQGGVYADPTNTNWNANAQGATGTLSNTLTRHFIINFATGTVMQTPAQRTAMLATLTAIGVGSPETADLRIDVARGLQVRARANSTYLPGNLVYGARQIDFIDPATYDARSYNLFCAACHTDYLPTISAGTQAARPDVGDTVADGVGLYSEKFRHTIDRGASTAVSPMPVRGGTTFTGVNLVGTASGTLNQMMCLSCHFAHGADASMMLLADNTRISANTGAAGTPTDPAQNDVSASLGGSSALKRYINQASCWHCHVRSSATPFLNTDYYWTAFPQGPTW